jgi:hypothetical protein
MSNIGRAKNDFPFWEVILENESRAHLAERNNQGDFPGGRVPSIPFWAGIFRYLRPKGLLPQVGLSVSRANGTTGRICAKSGLFRANGTTGRYFTIKRPFLGKYRKIVACRSVTFQNMTSFQK